ncbi:hypothetical protein BpHYR1_051886 [Brachionus plicatilis]|uniref:SWIM-type domain-containing protein n=1 Tax=Brachionus plicatilis TaxID=10195 RepID=A0A3M7RLQ5_BRAPC|nr:hypothetical protein BpHYR1_051886 [Brachionus plicatilis]
MNPRLENSESEDYTEKSEGIDDMETDNQFSQYYCLAFAKQHLCKHILAVSAQLKLADCVIPLAAKQIPIGQRRGHGRPKNVKRTLIKQNFVVNQYY